MMIMRNLICKTPARKIFSYSQSMRGLLMFQPIKQPIAFKDHPLLVEVTSSEPDYQNKVTELLAFHQTLLQQNVNPIFNKTDLLGQKLINPRIVTTEKSIVTVTAVL